MRLFLVHGSDSRTKSVQTQSLSSFRMILSNLVVSMDSHSHRAGATAEQLTTIDIVRQEAQGADISDREGILLGVAEYLPRAAALLRRLRGLLKYREAWCRFVVGSASSASPFTLHKVHRL
uniref:Uncharacterized protein n=1 Tax=Rhodosorus marinus TaxID=101924 RepID=A0A7S0BKX2_9RHOD|mmetsp:Transcript_19748/g.28735  ORF Transcript_19748/g.28735 Transcript_19748/m.28735 type:complete len:121 (+) Transcript_19748:154-516(+)